MLERNLETDEFEAAIYPIAPDGAQINFTCPNGSSKVTVDVVRSGTETIVTDDDDTNVPHIIDPKTGTIRFAVTPGHRYRAAVSR